MIKTVYLKYSVKVKQINKVVSSMVIWEYSFGKHIYYLFHHCDKIPDKSQGISVHYDRRGSRNCLFWKQRYKGRACS